MTTPPAHPSLSDVRAVTSLLGNSQRKEAEALKILRQHLASNPGYVAWSGGRDSTAALLLAITVEPRIPVVWFHSGLEYPETESYIAGLAERLKLNLHVIHAEPDALTLLKETGAWDHGAPLISSETNIHEALVTNPSQKAHALFGQGEVSGLRADESRGRRLLLSKGRGVYARKDGSQVVCPVWRWTAEEISGFLHRKDIPENPVYEKLASLGAPALAQRVGLIVDGNGVTMGRLTWLRAGWPELFASLSRELPRLREWR